MGLRFYMNPMYGMIFSRLVVYSVVLNAFCGRLFKQPTVLTQ